MRDRLVILLILLLALASPAPAQQTGPPLTQTQVMDLVRFGMDSNELARKIKALGIDFEPTDDYLATLRQAGAKEPVIQAIREVKPAPLTRDQVGKLVAGDVPNERATMLVKQHGIDFQADEQYLQTLRVAGADDALIAALRVASAAAVGELAVATSPGAAVYLDGALKGRADAGGKLILRASPGSHALKVSLDGRRDFEQNVTLAAHQSSRIQAQLSILSPPPPVRENPPPVTTLSTHLWGAGATSPYPLYAKWFAEYQRLHPNIVFTYMSIGSGGGIRQVLTRTVDFGASDQPLTDAQLRSAASPILHFPTVIGAVVPTYNLPGLGRELNLTGQVLADIFLGKITKWNDPALVDINPGVSLPDQAVVVVHRSDGALASYVWTDFLCKASPDWNSRIGRSTAVSWPIGLGGKGNEGVAMIVRQTPGAIGYVELAYARQNKLFYGRVRNSSGAFVHADFASMTAAAAGAAEAAPGTFRESITNAPGKDAFPLCSFTYLLVPSAINDAAKRQAIKDFLRWMLTDGQNDAEALSYARLPPEVVARELNAIGQIR